MHQKTFFDLSLSARLALLGFLFLGLSIFIYFGVFEVFWEIGGGFDFLPVYLASKAWVAGLNPYDYNSFNRLWIEAGGSPDYVLNSKMLPSIYPITAFPLIAPVTYLSWHHAKYLWATLNCLAFLGGMASLLGLANLKLKEWGTILVLAIIFWLSPIRDGLRLGNLAILAIFLIIISFYFTKMKYQVLPGILLAFSLSLKPQIGIIFFLYYLFIRQDRTTVSCLLTTAAIGTLAVFRLGIHDFSWFFSWQENIQNAFGSSGLNNPDHANPISHAIISLHYLLASITSNNLIINAVIIILMITASKYILKAIRLNKDNFHNLLTLSLIAVITLLPVYHRNVDGLILLIPLAFSIKMIDSNYYMFSKYIIGIIFIAFITGGPVWLSFFIFSGIIPASIAHTFWWQVIIMPFKTWLLIILAILLAYIVVREEAVQCAKPCLNSLKKP